MHIESDFCNENLISFIQRAKIAFLIFDWFWSKVWPLISLYYMIFENLFSEFPWNIYHYYMMFENLFNKFSWNIFQGKYGVWGKTCKVTGSSGTLISMSHYWLTEVVGHWSQCPTTSGNDWFEYFCGYIRKYALI